jgi:hypothetical protein
MHKAWIRAALAPALALLAGPLLAQQRAPTTVVACSGTFAKDSSHLKLAMFFDSKNITFTDVEASDGSKVPASVLFPDDPKRRLEVWWSNITAREDIYLIVIGGFDVADAELERAASTNQAYTLAYCTHPWHQCPWPQ